MPVEQDKRAADELHPLADPEREARERRLEVGQALDVILDVNLLQIAQPDRQKERYHQQSSGGVEPRCVLAIRVTSPFRFRRQRPNIVLGRNSASCGKISSRAMSSPIAYQNGQMPRKIVYIGTSGTIPFTMNTLMPTGGLSSPIWMISTATTPNHTRSTPSALSTGRTTGSVRISMEKSSMKVPSAR